jgi:hypothetical protein
MLAWLVGFLARHLKPKSLLRPGFPLSRHRHMMMLRFNDTVNEMR